MPTYRVTGTIPIAVSIEVEAETPEEAKAKADLRFPGLLLFRSNRGLHIGGPNAETRVDILDDVRPDFTTVEQL